MCNESMRFMPTATHSVVWESREFKTLTFGNSHIRPS